MVVARAAMCWMQTANEKRHTYTLVSRAALWACWIHAWQALHPVQYVYNTPAEDQPACLLQAQPDACYWPVRFGKQVNTRVATQLDSVAANLPVV